LMRKKKKKKRWVLKNEKRKNIYKYVWYKIK
jgi:hypothetical protein